MPWKLLAYIVLGTVLLLFVGFNLDNRTDVSFGFATVEQVPIFMSMFVSFVVGMLVAVPVGLRVAGRASRKTADKERKKASRAQARAAKSNTRENGESL